MSRPAIRGGAVLAILASALPAAVLRGTVVEAQTGKPLARTLVAVHPVTGSAGATKSARTNSYGLFEFQLVAAGAYIVSAARKGFAPIQYGQTQWKSAGTPVVIEEGQDTVLKIAMPRFGVITGRISDEADVGLVDHDVIAYRNTRPPVMAGKAATDDRGMYHIFGLEPGTYVVRAGAKQYDDGGGYLPTFYKETAVVDGAYTVEVKLDRETPDVNIRPTPGRLYSIGGQVSGLGTPPQTWAVSLISDMGYEMVTTDARGRFHFQPAAPGRYELLAQSPRGAGWLPVEIDRDRTETRVTAYPIPSVEFVFEDGKGGAVDASALQLMARRRDPTGPGPAQYLQLVSNHAQLTPGRWEFTLAPNASYYSKSWTPAVITYGEAAVHFAVAANPGGVHGSVTGASGEAAVGAPVYLECAGEVRSTRTDVHGAYAFVGLAPGECKIVSSFAMQTGGQPIQVSEGQDLPVDLKLTADSSK
jgi:hypothetical protein